MKKLFFAVILAIFAMAGCNKDEGQSYQLDGYQWITEEIQDEPSYRILLDLGKTKAGKFALAYIICEDEGTLSEGDILIQEAGTYTYDRLKGSLDMGGTVAKLSFVNETTIKIDVDGDVMVFTRASKKYNLSDAVEPAPAEFEITPEKESDWAGGSVQINANREDVTWSFELKGHPVEGTPYQNGSLATSISDNGLLTLAMYKKRYAASVYSITDAIIVVTAETADGQTATCEVTSKAWSVKFFDNQTNWTEIDINDISSGHDISFGPYDVNGQSIEDWDGPGVGFTWNHNCLAPYGNNGVDVCADVLNMSQIQASTSITDKTGDRYISVTYGAYENKYIIEDFR